MAGLEDHAGDMVRKSRVGLGIAAEEVATLLGWSLSALKTFEDEGVAPATETWQSVCQQLDLDADKLLSILQGWEPSSVELPWLTKIETDDGGMAVNAYLIKDPQSREAVLVDTGWSYPALRKYVEANQADVRQLFITHAHGDHIAALTEIREAIPEIEVLAASQALATSEPLEAGRTFSCGGLTIAVHETPGHAEDGLTFIVTENNDPRFQVALVGDALFAGSMGGAPRHFHLAKEKVRQVILSLTDEVVIAPGHGPLTQVGWEKQHNPFF